MNEFMRAKALYIKGNIEEAVGLFSENAADGDPYSALAYGYSLLYGIGVERDPSLAKSYFVYASELDGGEACYNLAVMYMHGNGVAVDYARSFKYMNEAAHKGCVEAQLYLGMAYTTGFWLEPEIVSISIIPYHTPDYALGPQFMIGGDVDNAELEEDLRSNVVRADANRAFEWFRTASRHSPDYVEALVAKGKFLYAKCFIDGFGVELNVEKGVTLMLSAGKSGSAEAKEFLAGRGIDEDRYLTGSVRKKSRERRG